MEEQCPVSPQSKGSEAQGSSPTVISTALKNSLEHLQSFDSYGSTVPDIPSSKQQLWLTQAKTDT